MRTSYIITVLFALVLTACEEGPKYDKSAPPVHTTIDVSAHAASSIGGAPLPILAINVETGVKEYEKVCGQLFGNSGCFLKGSTNTLHAGDQVHVDVSEYACVGDNCSLLDHTFTLPKNGQITKDEQFVGSNVKVTIKVKPLKKSPG